MIEDGASVQKLWGDAVGPLAKDLGATRVGVDRLKADTRIKVLFEDREVVAA